MNVADCTGLCVKYTQGEPLSSLPNLVDLRVRWVRDNVEWRVMEPSPGNYLLEFPADFQTRLDFYRANGIKLIFFCAYDNPCYADSCDVQAFGRYAARIAQMLKSQGLAEFVIELWNEPHNFVIGPKFGGPWNGLPPCAWLDRYVAMCNEAVAKVKAFDPTIRVIAGDDMWVLLYHMTEKGFDSRLTGLSFHPYVAWLPHLPGVPERCAVDWNTDWCAPWQVTDTSGAYTTAISKLRDRAKAKINPYPEFYVTEWGWPSNTFSQEEVSAYLVRGLILSIHMGVRAICWFSSYDGPDGPMGLVDNAGNKRLQYQAYKTFNSQVGNYNSNIKRIAGFTPNGAKGLQAFLCDGINDQKLIVWNVERLIQVRISGIVAPVVYDMFGKQLLIYNDGSGWILPASPSPIYITGIPKDIQPSLTII